MRRDVRWRDESGRGEEFALRVDGEDSQRESKKLEEEIREIKYGVGVIGEQGKEKYRNKTCEKEKETRV